MATIDSILTGGGDGTIKIPDYTTDIGRIATALETIATNSSAIKSSLENIEADLDTIATNNTTIANLATGNGIHVLGPWEWVGLSSIVKLLQDKGADFAALKAAVEALPKNY